MSLAKVTEDWIPLQIKVFTRWVNGQLKGVSDKELDDITKDLSTGVHLIELAQVLTQKQASRWNKNPNRTVFMVQNCDLAIDMFKKDGVQIIGISGKDINDNKVKLILGLVWTLILKYQIGKSIDNNASQSQPDQKSSKNALLDWAIERTANYPNVNNFQPYDLSMCALLDSYVPEKVNYNSLNPNDIEQNARRATDVMNDLGIPVYIYPDDVVKSGNKIDEKTLLTQLSSAKVVLDNLPPRVQERTVDLEKEEADRLAREKEEAERLAREKEEAERLARQNAANGDLMSIIEQLRRDLSDVKNQLNDANKRIDDSNERISNLEKENSSLQDALRCLKYEVKKLKEAAPNSYAQNQALSNSSNSIPADLIQKINQASDANQQVQYLHTENDSLKSALDCLKYEVRKLKQDQENQLNTENAQLRERIQKAESDIENLNSQTQGTPEDLTAERENLRRELKCLKYEVKKLKDAHRPQ